VTSPGPSFARRVGALELCALYRFLVKPRLGRMTDDQFKVLLRHLQVIVAILGLMAGVYHVADQNAP
jgi:hypothetical protein